MARKSINDPDFFEDDHLEEVGEPAGIVIPDEEDAAGDVVADDESGDGADDVVSDDESEGADGDSEELGDDDPAPHLADADPDTLKKVYADVRKFANQRDMAARKAEERIAELEASLAEIYTTDPEEDAGPQYDAQQFAQIAGDDPRAAFDYALQGGQVADAQATIARVQADSAELAAMAAIARQQDDAQSYQHWHSQATNAAALAQELQTKLSVEQHRQETQPLLERERSRNLLIAEQALDQSTNGEYSKRRLEVIQVLQRRPSLGTGHTAEEIFEGLNDALAIVAARTPAPAAPSAGDGSGVVSNVDEIAKEAVARAMAETRKAKAAAADSAAGGDTGRSAPAGTNDQPTEKDAIYQQAAQRSIGARGFMTLGS